MKVKMLIFAAIGMLTATRLMAWEPVGWHYTQWPYAYDTDEIAWYIFDTGSSGAGTMSVYNYRTSRSSLIGNTSLRGPTWVYFQWPYAYSWADGGWYLMDASTPQWCYNYKTRQWSVLSGPVWLSAGTYQSSVANSYSLWIKVDSQNKVTSAYLEVYYRDGWYTTSDKYTFTSRDIKTNGSSFEAKKQVAKFTSSGDSINNYEIQGTFQLNGTITGGWKGSYYHDPNGMPARSNAKEGSYTARR